VGGFGEEGGGGEEGRGKLEEAKIYYLTCTYR